ncbi:MAG: hypothetical protein H6741_06960 [Alphaproteobacteria bacterium]|nr:hypothetical protein [Alphaproteobacteria bacterium]
MRRLDLLRELRELDEVTGIAGIARRYFAMNAFDGVVTIIGVVTGSWAAGVVEPRVVLATGTSTALAMGISGVWGAYLTESAERARELRELEAQMLTDLSQTRLGVSARRAVWVVTLVDGASPVLAAGVALVPFGLAGLLPSVTWAYGLSLAVAVGILVALGLFLGRVSRGSAWAYALKTVLAGLMAIAVGLIWRAG